MKNELIYWTALSQVKGWRNENINKLIIRVFQENNITLEELFTLDNRSLFEKFSMSEKEIADFNLVKKELPQYSFLVEDLLAQGFDIVTLDSPDYSRTLKENLKLRTSPPVLYVKGNLKLLNEDSIAVVGSRDASELSLKFVDNVVARESKKFKVIVSGFAKGVDKQSLDSALNYIGHAIIVLPQGIMTFGSGINKYYNQIQNGDVLVLSTFHPKAPWSVQLAMARNTTIYGLAKEIYVAQSGDSGGTWSGVKDGLRRERKIYVRMPEPGEDNANLKLIEMGATPVDFDGNPIQSDDMVTQSGSTGLKLEDKLKELLIGCELTSTEIINKLKLDWSTLKLTKYLKSLDFVRIINTKPMKFTSSESADQNSLF